MERLGYRVVNVGERDIRMGYPEFARRTATSKLEFISANIVDRKSGEPIFPPHAVVEARSPDGKASVRVGVTGVMRYNPVFLKAGRDGGNMVIQHPLEAVKREVAALKKKKVDTIVLLAALHKNDAIALAQEVPGIEFVMGSYGGLVNPAEQQASGTTMMYVGNRGQRIGETRVFFGEGKQREIVSTKSTLHVLTRHYPPDHEMLQFVNALPREAPERAAPAAGSAAAAPAAGTQR